MTDALKNRLALVVDDSPDALTFVHDALEAAGLDVLVALEGKQALSIALKMKPDVILLDAMMPVMDGFETCKALKAETMLADTPVIFMTGLSDSEHIVKGLEAGGVDYLTKPVKPDELLARIRVHLANANITKAAYTALDQSGQMTLAVNAAGEQIWATPQAYTLLGKAGLQTPQRTDWLAQQLRLWLRTVPEVGYLFHLENPDYQISVRLVSTQGGEWVLRLIDGERPSGAELLRQKLKVTERESQVIYWIANGKTNRETADILNMSPRTVNKHLEQIFVKLAVDNRTSAAGIALKALAQEEALV